MLFTNACPPSNDKAEMVVIAAILPPVSLPPDCVGIDPAHCSDPVYEAILRTACDLAARGMTITAASLATNLSDALNEVGGVAYLKRLASLAPTPEAVGEAAATVRDCWTRRHLIDLGESLQRLGEETVQNAFELTSSAPAHEQALAVKELLAKAASDAASITDATPDTVQQSAKFGAVEGSMLARITPHEMKALAYLNTHLAGLTLAPFTGATQQTDMHLARATLFSRMAGDEAAP